MKMIVVDSCFPNICSGGGGGCGGGGSGSVGGCWAVLVFVGVVVNLAG